MDRVILHCDCNSFFASVETVLDPSLSQGPMAVCGNPESRHGIVLAKNEAAKRCGVQTAETLWQAKRKCPGIRFVLPHHEAYREFSRRVNAIYENFTDLVEPFGIDESWLDITGSMHLFGTPKEIADRLRREVYEQTGLTISVGVSFNKVFAKLGSDYRKPNATTVINREDVPRIVWPLPVGSMLYVGAAAQKVLSSLYIETIGQLAHSSRDLLSRRLGQTGEMLYDYANGIDNDPVHPIGYEREIKSVGNGSTFRRDLTNEQDIRVAVSVLSDEVAMRLRKKALCCRTVQLTIRDPALRTITRRHTLDTPTSLEGEISNACMEIFRESYAQGKPVRMLTVTAMNLLPAEAEFCEQLSLFGGKDRERRRRLETTVDSLRGRFGKSALTTGAVLASDFISSDDNNDGIGKHIE